MRLRGLVILASLVFGVALFLLTVDRHLPSTDERREQARRLLSGCDADAVDELAIVGPGAPGGRLVLRRVAAAEEAAAASASPSWRLVTPVSGAADGEVVAAVLAAVEGLETQRTLDGMPAASAGLEPPRLVLTAAQGERQHVVEIGAAVPASHTMLVRVAESPAIEVVDDALFRALDRPLLDWRARALVAMPMHRIDRVRVEQSGGGLELVRDEGEWRRDGETIPFAPVDRLLQTLYAARAEGFEPVPRTSPEPRLAITLEDGDGNEERVRLVAGEDGTVWALVAGQPERLRLASELLVDLDRHLTSLRETPPRQ